MDSGIVNSTYNSTASYGLLGGPLIPDTLMLAYNVYLLLIIVVGVFGNLVVLLVFAKSKVSTSTDWFIVFITIFDFISSAVNVPVYLTFTNGTWQYYGNNTICKMHMYFSQVVTLTSAFTTCELAIERYIKVSLPRAKHMSRTAARNACFTTCFISFIGSVPSAHIFTNIDGVCTVSSFTIGSFIYYAAVFILFLAVCIVVPVCYIRICITIRNSERRVNAHDSLSSSQQSQSGQPVIRMRVFASNKVKPYLKSTGQAQSLPADGTEVANIPSTRDYSGSRNAADSQTISSQIMQSLSDGSPAVSTNVDQTSGKLSFCRGQIMIDVNQHTPTKTSSHCNCTTSNETPSQTVNSVGPALGQRRINVATLVQNWSNVSPRLFTDMPSRVTTSRCRANTTKIAFLVCTIYIVSWTIPWTCFVLLFCCRNITTIRFALFGKMTHLINTITNPFLYTMYNVKFRKNLKELVGMCKPR